MKGTRSGVSIFIFFLAFLVLLTVGLAQTPQNPSWVAPIVKWDANAGATITIYDPNTYLPGVKPVDATCLTCHNGGRQPDSPGYSGTEDSPMPPGAQTSPFDGNGYFISGHGNVLRKVMPIVSSVPLVPGTGAPGVAPSPGGLGTTAGSWGFIPLSSCTTATQATDCAAYRGAANWKTGTSLRGLAASWSQIGDASCVVYTSHTVSNTGCMFPITGSLSAAITGITAPWGDHNGDAYTALDPYGSLSLFDLNAGIINVGGTGDLRSMYYVFGGWSDTLQLNSIWNGGFTGEQWEHGNYDCARCHTTGYRFDALGTEPTTISSPTVAWNDINGPTFYLTYSAKIPDAQFSRAPSNGACSDGVSTNYSDCVAAGGTWPTSSWYATGIQCSRCHGNNYCTGAATKAGTQPPPGLDATNTPQCGWVDTVKDSQGLYIVRPARPYEPINQQATALCLECHRTENITAPTPPATLGEIHPAWSGSVPEFADGGSCSDGVSADYPTCVAISGNTWNYAPFFDHEAGLTFLNSPHARFSGTVDQNVQNSVDLSVNLIGIYSSHFTDWGEGMTVDESAWNSALPVSNPPNGTGPKPLANGGCTGCHNPHDSLVMFSAAKLAAPGGSPATPAYGQPDAFAMPAGKKCADCHQNGSRYSVGMPTHSTGNGTPFPDGADQSKSCVICHMAAASGAASYHFFRINPSVSYNTFPTAAQFYGGQTAPNTATEVFYGAKGPVNYAAVGLDVDIACGQCHTGGTGTNPYGMVSTGAPVFTRSALSTFATGIHNTVPKTAQSPTFSVAGSTYYKPFSVVISEATPNAQICYTTDGSTPVWQDTTPTAENATMSCKVGTQIQSGGQVYISQTTTLKAVGGGTNSIGNVLTPSAVASITYTINIVPTAPTFSPVSGSTLTKPASTVTITAQSGMTIYYTLNGSIPTTTVSATNFQCANNPCTTSPLNVSGYVRAIAVASGGQKSAVATAAYAVK